MISEAYLSRRADILAIPVTTEIEGFPSLSFTASGDVQGTAGINQLAQWVTFELFSEAGNSPYFDHGTFFLEEVRQSGDNQIFIIQAFNRAALRLQKKAAAASEAFPLDERLASLQLLSISFVAQDIVDISVRVQSQAGEVVEFVMPLNYNVTDYL